MAQITAQDAQKMVRHWLDTPCNAYLGSDYGQDAKSLLQRPLSDGLADSFLQKLREDVPVVGVLPPGAVNLYAEETPPDRLHIFIDIAGQDIDVSGD